MESQPIDPETYFTKDKLVYMPKIGGIEERLEGTIGTHIYELCLLQTYWKTEKFLKGCAEIDKIKEANHLFSLKADIMRYCMPHGLDWKKLMEKKQGYLIITPNYESAMFYRFMANNLFILDESLTSRFLDFHLVNTVLKFKHEREHAPNLIDSALIRFLQEIDFFVIHGLERNMPFERNGVIQKVKDWVRRQMDKLSEKLLVQYHAYQFEPESTSEHKPYETISQVQLVTSCPPTTLKDYFLLLTNSNPEVTAKVPFVSKQKVLYILYKWFGIGDETTDEQDPTVTIDRAQLLFFLYNFKSHFCKSRKPGMVKSEDLIRLAIREFGDLFVGIELSNQVQNFKRDANREAAYHRSLDFKHYPSVMNSYEELKKSKTI